MVRFIRLGLCRQANSLRIECMYSIYACVCMCMDKTRISPLGIFFFSKFETNSIIKTHYMQKCNEFQKSISALRKLPEFSKLQKAMSDA